MLGNWVHQPAEEKIYARALNRVSLPEALKREGKNAENITEKQTGGPWDIISFNFPHIGGKSTDVNRQVRANQELLVAFFKACVPLLSTSIPKPNDGEYEVDYGTDSDDSSRYHTDSEEEDDEDELASDNDADKVQKEEFRTVPRQSGQIVVTIFEGEPYTLWNIKDLARHAGLAVVTSFRFPWKSYPGYAHARTLGIVENRHSGKTGGGWKGEDRDARTYVFEVKQEKNGDRHQSIGKKKKRRDEDTSDEDD
jgi:25S rRNA (uracil2634-N3)-methyltransferase